MPNPIFLSPVDFSQNEALNIVLQNLAVAPSNPVEGQMFYNTVQKKHGIWRGEVWQYGNTLTFANAAPISWSVVNDIVTLTIADATSTLRGLMVVSDKIKLDGATAANIFNTIVYRDSAGNAALTTLIANKVTGLVDPVADNDAATKKYVDAVAQGLTVKAAVRIATTANIGLTGLQLIDGVNTVIGDLVLVKNQATAGQNGIWIANSAAWTRAADFAVGFSAKSSFMFVSEGTANAESGWTCTNDNGADTVGTANLGFTQFSGAGQINAGNGMVKTGNTIDMIAGDASIIMAADSFRVGVDNITLEVIAGVGIRVKANSITAAHINPSALGTGLVGGNGTPIAVANYLPIAGTSITRTSVVAGNVGGGVGVTFTHGLGTKDVQVLVKNATTDEPYIVNWLPTGINTVSVTANGPTLAVKVIVQG
jgi:hypothetical protein